MNRYFESKIFHPFLFAAFPVLFLFAANVNMVPAAKVWLPLVVTLGFAGAILFLSRLVFRNWYKAELFASGFVIFFFLYDPLFIFIKTKPLFSFLNITRQNLFIFAFLIPLIGLAWYLFRSKNSPVKTRYILNITALILLFPSALKLIWNYNKPEINTFNKPAINVPVNRIKAPDIYYFITDAYSRADVLKETFHFDNSSFLNSLRKRGFYIAGKSTSNYYFTVHSVPSTLNLDYLQSIIGSENLNRKISPKKLVENSALRGVLENCGYQYISYASGVEFTEVENADVYLSDNFRLSEFDIAIINLTPLSDIFNELLSRNTNTLYRRTILYPFENIRKAIEIPAAKFVQIHILSPHAPFVFDQFGNDIEPETSFDFYRQEEGLKQKDPQLFRTRYRNYSTGYTNQIRFLNQKLLQAIDTILANSAAPPVIIIQGDHGSRLNCHLNDIKASNHYEGFANLSAFYFPNQDTTGLYNEISNVNTFLVVLNKYFKTRLPLLPDKSYYSTEHDPYKFTEVTKAVRTKIIGPIQQ